MAIKPYEFEPLPGIRPTGPVGLDHVLDLQPWDKPLEEAKQEELHLNIRDGAHRGPVKSITPHTIIVEI